MSAPSTSDRSHTSKRPANAAPRRAKPAAAKLVWRHATCRVCHTPNYLTEGWSHIEIEVVSPKRAPLPITATGYRSHFLNEDELAHAGGPVAFFQAWLDREARSKAWGKTEFNWRQGDLFAGSS